MVSGEPLACLFLVKNFERENIGCFSVFDAVIAILTCSDADSGACLGDRFVWCDAIGTPALKYEFFALPASYEVLAAV